MTLRSGFGKYGVAAGGVAPYVPWAYLEWGPFISGSNQGSATLSQSDYEVQLNSTSAGRAYTRAIPSGELSAKGKYYWEGYNDGPGNIGNSRDHHWETCGPGHCIVNQYAGYEGFVGWYGNSYYGITSPGANGLGGSAGSSLWQNAGGSATAGNDKIHIWALDVAKGKIWMGIGGDGATPFWLNGGGPLIDEAGGDGKELVNSIPFNQLGPSPADLSGWPADRPFRMTAGCHHQVLANAWRFRILTASTQRHFNGGALF